MTERQYIWTQITPDRIEEGDAELIGDTVHVQARRPGIGAGKRKVLEGEDWKVIARRVLRELVQENGPSSFWDPLPPASGRGIV